MVDSSVGGKVGVNAAAGKNLVGAFKQPKCVVVDPAVVATMEPRKYRAGLAEVLKHGVIDDPDFFAWQESAADALASGAPEAVARAVADSCRIKARYVAQDETERGVRAHLNYGHTFGHALEQDGRYATYLHGEALAIGMRMAEKLATALGFLKDGGALAARQDALLKRYGLPLAHRCADPRVAAEKLADLCLLDKKAEGGTARFVLPTRLGKVEVRSVADLAAVREAFLGAMERA
jgi:3-dehydroquinate synthase